MACACAFACMRVSESREFLVVARTHGNSSVCGQSVTTAVTGCEEPSFRACSSRQYYILIRSLVGYIWQRYRGELSDLKPDFQPDLNPRATSCRWHYFPGVGYHRGGRPNHQAFRPPSPGWTCSTVRASLATECGRSIPMDCKVDDYKSL